jgi:uncharacterized protein (TIGR02145 family)
VQSQLIFIFVKVLTKSSKMKSRIRLYAVLIIGFTLFFTSNCKKDESLPVPVLATNTVSDITQTTATCGGSITSDGGLAVTTRGVCWSNTSNPTISNSKTIDGAGAGSFLSNMTDLVPNTAYFVRAYATNSAGTGYGMAMSFTTEIEQLPVLTTTSISDLVASSATCGGNITNDGGASIIARGVCWSTSQNPNVTNNHTSDGTGTGIFTSSITGLIKGTTYFVRAFATNIAGTSYGQELSFIAGILYDELSDIDGNVYKTLRIGTQTWMAENLRTTKYNDGTAIPLATDNTAWLNLTTPAYCWYNNDSATYGPTYGALYNWYTVNTGKLCPTGWHVPSDAEWKTLEIYLGLGMTQEQADVLGWRGTDQGTQLKNTSGWIWGNGTNTSGFSALPGGGRYYYDGKFDGVGNKGVWWSSTKLEQGLACGRSLRYSEGNVLRFDGDMRLAYSVRCLRDL